MEQDNPQPPSGFFGDNALALFDALRLPAFLYQLNETELPVILHATPALTALYEGSSDLTAAIFAADDDAVLEACRQAIRQTAQPRRFHMRLRSADGDTLHFSGQANGIQWQGQMLGIAILFDMSRDEALHRQMAKEMQDAALQTLVAGLVHDFRNTLTHLIGTTELLLFKCRDSETTESLQLMLKSSERGSEMLNRLQHMVRIPSAPAVLQSDDGWHAALAAMLELLGAGLPARIRMQSRLATPLPATAMALPQIRQILLALVSNATEAIPAAGQIDVELTPTTEHRFKADQPALCIRVSDNGTGIAREHLDEVTRPFWTTHDEPGKLGLGLAIVSRLVRLHGGKLDIQSRPAAGTTVTVLLPPLAPATGTDTAASSAKTMRDTAMPATAAKTKTEAPTGTMRPWHILLVDDSPEVLQVHQSMLERMGHKITPAFNGYDALNLYNERHGEIDLLITDFRMPGMDGVDLATAIRHIHAELPVLMITAYGDASKLQQVHEMHIELLDKPVSYMQLEQKLIGIQQQKRPGPR